MRVKQDRRPNRQITVPKSFPMPAVSAIARAPQNVTRSVARRILAPPARAPIAPSTARKAKDAADTMGTSALAGDTTTMSNGMTAPTENDAADQDSVRRRGRRGHADDQACGRDDAVVGAKHRGAQPTDAVDEVALRMQAKTAHPMLRLSDQSRPSSMRMTTMIKMVPRIPTPP